MVNDAINTIKKTINDGIDFVDKNFDEPFLWIALFLILFIVSVAVINALGDT